MFPHDSHLRTSSTHHDNNGGEDDPLLIFFPPDFTTLPYPPTPPLMLQDHVAFQLAAAAPTTPLMDPASSPNFTAALFPDPALQPPPQNVAVAAAVPAISGKMRKNIIHREVERQRRKEMTTLQASLRNLLPLRFVKGKRAVSDHMQAAVEYIRELQGRMDELGKKRDELKTGTATSTAFGAVARAGQVGSSSRSNYTADGVVSSSNVIRVCPSLIGVEVAINISTSSGRGGQQAGMQLSRVMELLMGQGFDVVTCDTVRVNERFIHTLQSKARDPSSCVDVAALQSLLKRAMGSLGNSRRSEVRSKKC